MEELELEPEHIEYEPEDVLGIPPYQEEFQVIYQDESLEFLVKKVLFLRQRTFSLDDHQYRQALLS
jgi:hypothetical protein